MLLYDIQMCTPLGNRRGQLRAKVQDGKLQGDLSLLGRTQPIDGTVHTDGTWEFQGKLVTLRNIIDYRATGKEAGKILRLSLEGKGQSYAVTGTLREEGK